VVIARLHCLLLVALLLPIACGVRAPASPQNAVTDLGGTSWQLVKFQSSDERMLTPDDPTKYTISFRDRR
jgi:hypothetical protein